MILLLSFLAAPMVVAGALKGADFLYKNVEKKIGQATEVGFSLGIQAGASTALAGEHQRQQKAVKAAIETAKNDMLEITRRHCQECRGR